MVLAESTVVTRARTEPVASYTSGSFTVEALRAETVIGAALSAFLADSLVPEPQPARMPNRTVAGTAHRVLLENIGISIQCAGGGFKLHGCCALVVKRREAARLRFEQGSLRTQQIGNRG
jgi:hypothetical protein